MTPFEKGFEKQATGAINQTIPSKPVKEKSKNIEPYIPKIAGHTAYLKSLGLLGGSAAKNVGKARGASVVTKAVKDKNISQAARKQVHPYSAHQLSKTQLAGSRYKDRNIMDIK